MNPNPMKVHPLRRKKHRRGKRGKGKKAELVASIAPPTQEKLTSLRSRLTALSRGKNAKG